ncbi:PTS system mannose/fructose/N-acetylgalactosamine-transporter subunit IIB [Anaerorhabdus sp.]|nr:PTS sugar transporter subunit IIB [Anaerorhabdus sp.]MEA4875455.1 PTS sugar transporter subunit IIB [Anaerorhabdus sp.]
MAIILCRVDDRLIHGQVATSWLRSNEINVAVVIDDAIANDPMQLQILKMAAPSGVKVYAQTIDKFIEKYNQGILDDYRVMLIFSNVYAPLALAEKGLVLKTLNVAGMRYREGRRQITKSVFINPEEEKTIKKLSEKGVELEFRQLMTDAKQELLKLL